ncbi:MAG: hypothetical protein IPJ65_43325 [Archangiaceae bacterium]|nr:hypothetical protein [Archangiaceae bacterium]
MSLSRRWLSYVLSRFQTNGEVLGTLRALVPRQDYKHRDRRAALARGVAGRQAARSS